jgi:hypothetical protein
VLPLFKFPKEKLIINQLKMPHSQIDKEEVTNQMAYATSVLSLFRIE